MDLQAAALLEDLLLRSAEEEQARPLFYKQVLTSDLVLIIEKPAQKGEEVNIICFPDRKIPIFSQEARIFDNNVIKESLNTLTVPAREIFQQAKGATFILNPYSESGKEFIPEEIEAMLSGRIFQQYQGEYALPEDENITIVEPKAYPKELTNALSELFADHSEVKAAYLSWMYQDAVDSGHYLVALDLEGGDGEYRELIQTAGFVAQQFLKDDEIIDFTSLDAAESIENHFRNQGKPFYIKK